MILIANAAYSQANCEKNLNDARSEYANGNLYAIPGKLTDCLSDGFSKTEKIEAYQLLALTYININQLDKARESLIKLLKLKTDYTVTKNVDADELYSLYKKIDTEPIYYLGAGIGINNTFAYLKHSEDRQTTASRMEDDNYQYSSALSITGGIQFIYPIFKIIHAKAAVSYDINQYNYNQRTSESELNLNETETRYSASNAGLNILLSTRVMTKNKLYKLYRPFIETGIVGRLHTSSKIKNYYEKNLTNPREYTVDEINMNKYRNNMNFGLNAQIGSLIKFNENYIEISIGATYYTIPETDYSIVLHRNLATVGNAKTVIEDNYDKFVLNLTINFNIPFYNFK